MNRESILSKFIEAGNTRADGKQFLSKILFDNVCKYKDYQKIHSEIYDSIIPKLKEIYPIIEDTYNGLKDKSEKTNSFLALLLQTVENRVITLTYHFLKENNIKSGLVIHDALLVSNSNKFEELELFIPKMKRFIKTNYFGVDIDFKLNDFKTSTLQGHEHLLENNYKLTPKDIIDSYFNYTKDIGSSIIIFNKLFYVCEKKTNLWKCCGEHLVKTELEDFNFQDFLLGQYDSKIEFTTFREWENVFKLLNIDSRFNKIKSDFDFDNNPNLISFNNGKCIELFKFNKEIPFVIRDLKPNDFCVMNTKYSLDFDNISTEYLNECKTIITNMFQNPETAESYLSIIGSSISGELLIKKFVINQGCGNNGRSFFANLVSQVLGDYHGSFSSSFFLSSNNCDSDIKSPEAVSNIKKRFITINEPPTKSGFNNTTFDSEKIKTFSGNDIISIRSLQSNDIVKFINPALMVMCLNSSPYFVTIDNALVERIVVVPQDTSFVDNPQLGHERPKFRDTEFLRDSVFKNHMMSIFLSYWVKFVKNDLKIQYSSQIQEASKDLMTDYIDTFMETYYKKTINKKDIMIFDDIFSQYTAICNHDNLVGKKSNDFKKILISKGFTILKLDQNDKKGVRIRKLGFQYLTTN